MTPCPSKKKLLKMGKQSETNSPRKESMKLLTTKKVTKHAKKYAWKN